MSEVFPTLSMALIALLFLYKIYKRSIATFVFILTASMAIVLIHYKHIEIAETILLTVMIVMLIRAMFKPDTDRVLYVPGVSKKNKCRS